MKKPGLRLSFTVAALFFAASFSSAAPIPVPSRATAVTVYPDRALVTRVATLSLAAGETEIQLADLPADLSDASLQIRGQGPAGTSVIDVQSRNLYVAATPSPQIRELEDALDALQRDQRALDDETKALDNERNVLAQITAAASTVPTEGNAPRPSIAEWNQLLTFNAENTRRLAAAQRDLAIRRETLTAKVTAANNQLNEARGRQPTGRSVKSVTVRLASPTAGPGSLEISYTVPGARWIPLYRARLDSASRQTTLDYQAQVTNRTGEAWENVALTLSTARPSAGGSAPEPLPWIVEANEEIRLSSFAVMQQEAVAAPAVRMQDKMLSRGRADDMAVQTATVESGLTSATFKITTPATIPADGSAQKVTVTRVVLDSALRHDTTPKFQEAAFLTAKVKNTSDFPFLPGTLSAFVDGAFIAESHLDQTMPGAEFDLALGVDESLEIKRTLINRFVEKTGFTNSGTRVTYEVKLTLTNHKSIPALIKLAEPLPVSRHEKIVVKIIEPSARDIGTATEPKAFQRDDEGILTWTGSLAPGAKRELTLKFSVEYPNDLPVSGVE